MMNLAKALFAGIIGAAALSGVRHAENERRFGVDLTGGLVPLCERKLAAFARGVQAFFGPEQARQAIEDWMAELESMDWRSQETFRDWRGLTIAAAVRLDGRVNHRQIKDRC